MLLHGKNGTSIKLIMQNIKSMFDKKYDMPKFRTTRTLKNSFSSGKLVTNDWKNICTGLSILGEIADGAFYSLNDSLLAGEENVSKYKQTLSEYRYVLTDLIFRASSIAGNQYDIQHRIDILADRYRMLIAANDGILTKQQTRQELINGKVTTVTYDTSISPGEILETFRNYESLQHKLQSERFDTYLGMGLAAAGTIGTIFQKDNFKDKSFLITLASTALGGLKLIEGLLVRGDYAKQTSLRDEQYTMTRDFLYNEQVSIKSEESSLSAIQSVADEDKKISAMIEGKKMSFGVIVNLIAALMSGSYINKHTIINENGTIDGKSLSSAIISLTSSKNISRNWISSVRSLQHILDSKKDFKVVCAKVNQILSQMDEKVYPLKGAQKSFNSLEISDFVGNFYPKTDYQTGETTFSTTLNIPEFSMKRGDVVLLSGESGTGKSTFLRLLKRGDINNQGCIKLDNNETVDHLGSEYISFTPSLDLGDEQSILFEITGKRSISDLDKNEIVHLTRIMNELKLDFPNLLSTLASRSFMEFSTGQQRRLALSKLFYRIDDGTSVIIVDEPVGNVEDSLIREQLEMIRNYAKEKDVMLLLTTHRLDLAEDLATKRYHIEDGTMKQIPIKNKTEIKNDKTDLAEER